MCLRVVAFKGHAEESQSILLTKLCAGFESVTQLLSGEFSLRTASNLDNLHVMRGLLSPTNGRLLLETSMSGPHHYFGFLDPLLTYRLHVSVSNGELDVRAEESQFVIQTQPLPQLPTIWSLALEPNVDFQWMPHNLATDPEKSLFSRPGTFQVLKPFIHIPTIHRPQDYDWKSFRAELVAPKASFRFNPTTTKNFDAAKHKVRLLTYYYGRDYFERFCQPHRSDFLEHHEFVQFIHAIDQNSKGYMVLGRMCTNGELQLVKFQIPCGYTLVLDAGCIHGDARLVGLYVMGMTGNHDAMRTADTVFVHGTNIDKGFVQDCKHGWFRPLMTHSENNLKNVFAEYSKLCKSTIATNVQRKRPLSGFFWQPALVDGFGLFRHTLPYKDWVQFQQLGGRSLLESLGCGFV